jgi:hypothetical protein
LQPGQSSAVASLRPSQGRISFASLTGVSSLSAKAQDDFEGGALSFAAGETDLPSVQFDAAFYDDQPEAGPGNLPHIARAMKRLEKPSLVLLRNATAVVLDLKYGGRAVSGDVVLATPSP